MLINDLIAKYPKLYHMAENGSWPNIQKLGLLSTSALLTKFGYIGANREEIECKWRPQKITIYHSKYGEVVIRDQKPMSPERLGECLPNAMKVEEWYKFINKRIFFWTTRRSLEWFLSAQEYKNKPQLVITVDTHSLVHHYSSQITLSSINTGSTYPKKGRDRPEPRSKETFKKIQDYHLFYVTELAVDSGIPDITDITMSVARWIAHKKGYDDPVYEKLEDIWPE